MAAQLLALVDREEALHVPHVAPRLRRAEADHALVAGLEADALLLDDVVGRARLEDAQAIVRELVEARHRLEGLLDALSRAPTEDTRRELLAELARAEQRLDALSQRLAALGTDVPTDFANREALSPSEAEDDVREMRDALARGDVDAARARLDALGRRLEQLAGGLGSAGHDFSESRFGERDRALAEALDALAGLESEQRSLAERTGEVSRTAAQRAEAAGGAADRAHAAELAGRARALEGAANRLDGRHLPESEGERLDGLRQRLADTADSLASGDVAEASAMAARAADDAASFSEDLAIEAEMFSGEDGHNAQAARAARDVARRAAELSRAIDAASPGGADVEPGERRAMQADVPRQRRVRDASGGIADRLAQGPDGTPLSSEGEEKVRDAMRAMQAAEGSLGHGDAREAARLQDEAARKLHDLREQLEQDRSSGGGGGGSGDDGGDGEEGRDSESFHEPVVIPGADDARGPEERRRHVLDAMRDGAPAGWESAVRRYYEEVLR